MRGVKWIPGLEDGRRYGGGSLTKIHAVPEGVDLRSEPVTRCGLVVPWNAWRVSPERLTAVTCKSCRRMEEERK